MRAYNVDLLDRSDYGGFWRRVLALVVDSLILWLPSLALAFCLGVWFRSDFSLNQSRGIQAMAAYGAAAVYSVYFWASRWHATPGKRLVGLIVVADDGSLLGVGRSAWRLVGQVVSGLVIVGPLLVIGSERRQALHDLLAGTVVVKARAAERVKVKQVVVSDPRTI